jgi:hypothetical protein
MKTNRDTFLQYRNNGKINQRIVHEDLKNKMTKAVKYIKANKICFYRDGKQVFDFIVRGNLYLFSNGDLIVI